MKQETPTQENEQEQNEHVEGQQTEKPKQEEQSSPQERLSEMKAETARAMASDVFTDIIGPLNYYLPRVADDGERDRLERQRMILRARIGNYFNEDNPLIPSGGFVSQKMEQ